MKLTCTQENLALGLSMTAHVGDKNINLPILQNVLLNARKDGLTLVATNLEIAIRTKIRGKIEKEGDFTVNARLLSEFVASLKKENVDIGLEEKNLHIKGENHQTTIRGLDANDFPIIPTVEPLFTIVLAAITLREALSQTLFAVSSDESRPELNGAYLHVSGSHCTLVATDSYRLSEKAINLKKAAPESRTVIIPSRTLREIERILDIDAGDSVTITINETQVLFRFGETEVVSRIIAGDYPDYKQIIPKSFKHEVAFNTTEMVSAIKTTSLFCKQGINDVRISLDKRFKDIAVNAENSILGKNISNVPSLSEQQEMDIVFNYKFFLDGLAHLTGDTAVLKTNDATSPALLVSPKEKDFLYIIMPIRQ